jgi:exodeoxyribonuclease VII small subunit
MHLGRYGVSKASSITVHREHPPQVRKPFMSQDPNQETATPEADETSFETNLEQLEEIVSQLEQGDLPLEEALALYERGVNAYRNCHEKLEEAETKVVKLVETLEGELQEEPFEVPQDDQ